MYCMGHVLWVCEDVSSSPTWSVAVNILLCMIHGFVFSIFLYLFVGLFCFCFFSWSNLFGCEFLGLYFCYFGNFCNDVYPCCCLSLCARGCGDGYGGRESGHLFDVRMVLPLWANVCVWGGIHIISLWVLWKNYSCSIVLGGVVKVLLSLKIDPRKINYGNMAHETLRYCL